MEKRAVNLSRRKFTKERKLAAVRRLVMGMKLWFETHSTSVDNERGIASGHLDPPLSQLGHMQAAELGVRYAGRRLGIIYTSDLNRAVSTADIAFTGASIRRVRDSRLRECNYGNWSGCPVQALHEAKDTFLEIPFPDGESFHDVVRRIESFLKDVDRGAGDVLVIAHRAPWYALERLLRGRPLSEIVSAQWKWQPGWEYDL